MIKEIWKDITGYEGSYQISNHGRVKSISRYRLVAEHFIPNSENKLTVNHIDGNKLNNYFCNLEWSTHSEQMEHAVKTQLIKPRGKLKFSPDFQQKVHDYFKENNCSILQLAKIFNISQRTAGRFAKEIKGRNIKLTDDQVEQIKLQRSEGMTLSSIANIHNCGISQIHRIIKGLSRKVTYERE